jgi:DNA-binding transcriptional MerR regulator/methylmalonyl-CoA mutase cobalamin-binding subunit
MENDERHHKPSHSLGVVCRRTGLKPDRLRAWERRYGVVQPQRSEGNQRLYSEANIERLLLLRQATDAGHRIANIADLETDGLRDLVMEDSVASMVPPVGSTAGERAKAGGFVRSSLAAIQQLDIGKLEATLKAGSEELPSPAFLQELLVPLLHRVGDLWADGGLRAVHEHAATAVVRRFVDGLHRAYEALPDAPGIVLTTPAGQLHEIGALLASAAAAGDGWDVTYLGPNLPAEEIALVARQKASDAVGLSILYPDAAEDVTAELLKLRRHLGSEAAVIVGGRSAHDFAPTLDEIAAVLVEDLTEFRAALAELVARRSAGVGQPEL